MLNNIIPPVLGAIIGYFTNWLAIKMLFIPHNPKYIGKVRVPFTPGLIPKEREKLANKIANVIGEKVLNKETIKENLFSNENKEKLYLLIEKSFNNLKESNYTINDILDNLYQDKKYGILSNIEETILYNIKAFLDNESNQKVFSNLIVEKVFNYIDNPDKNKQIKEKTEQFIINLINNKKFKEDIYNMKLSYIIDNESILDVKIAIFENVPKICNFIAKKIETDNNLNEKLSIFVKNIIEENVGTFTGLFLNTDKVYNSIRKNVIEYLKSTEKQNIIGIKIFEIISVYQNQTIMDISNKFSEQTKNIIKEKFKDENIKKYMDKTRLLDNINNIILRDNLKLKENASKVIEDIIKNKLSNG
ncbi:DUF445 family protein, partial [uncultured Tyzzerella sp.]|uniref:DUF445 domain-containing protein n=1 Tax=uncultured Tyzzerella sp. TaxID=2321398 RepID=UPI002943B144